MKIKALVTFAGVLTMTEGEVAEYDNEIVLRDLLRAGYITPVETAKPPVPAEKGAENAGKPNNNRKSGAVPKTRI